MVLKFISGLLFFIFMFPQTELSLLLQYEKKIAKITESEFVIDNFKLLETNNRPFAYWEAYKNEKNDFESTLIIASIFTCNLGGCTAEQAYAKSKSSQEYFDLVLELSDDKISKIKVLQYFSDYGYEISSKNYLKKYIGRSICDFTLSNTEVDIISGATISCDALQYFLGSLCD